MNDQWLPLLQHIIPLIEILLIVIFVDFILGIASSLKKKEFDVKKLPDFLAHYGLQILGWLGLELLSIIPEGYLLSAGATRAIGDIAMGFIVAGALGSIFKSAKELGIIPEIKKPAG